ncbi:hypothetical protein DMENIID0001_080820 [Sergentomyia squamirostris]
MDESSFDIVQFLNLIVMILGYYQSTCKFIICCVIYREKLHSLLEYLDDLASNRDSLMWNIRTRVMTKDIKFVIKIGKFFAICCCGSTWAFIVAALLHSKFTYVAYFTYPFVKSGSMLDILLNIGLEAITIHTTVGIMISIDAINFFVSQYLKGEYGSISQLLLSLNNDSSLSDAKSEMIIFTSYRCHVKVTEKLGELQTMCWYIYLNQVYTSILYTCMILYMIRFGESSASFYFIPPGVICTIFLLCYTGQIVIDGTDQVIEALGQIKWYRLNVRNQRNLILFMVFAQRSRGLRTFAFSHIGMETFLQLLKAICSYWAFLYTVLS